MSCCDYIDVIPDYLNDFDIPTSSADQKQLAKDDGSTGGSGDQLVTSPYEHARRNAGHQEPYERLITSQGTAQSQQPVDDETYDEIGEVPSPPPLRPEVNRQFTNLQQQPPPQQQQQQQQQAPSSKVVYVSLPPPAPPVWTGQHYRRRQSNFVGVVLIVVGVLSIGSNTVGLVSSDGTVGHGIFCGFMFIVSGAFGICAGSCTTKCLVVTFLVLCIWASLWALGQLITTAGLNEPTATTPSATGVTPNTNSETTQDSNSADNDVDLATEVVMMITAAVATVACIWGTVVGCHGVCSCCYSNDKLNNTTPAINTAAATTGVSYQHPVPVVGGQATAMMYQPAPQYQYAAGGHVLPITAVNPQYPVIRQPVVYRAQPVQMYPQFVSSTPYPVSY